MNSAKSYFDMVQTFFSNKVPQRGLSSFVRDRSGNVALTFAIALMALVTVAGGAIDYANTLAVRGRLQFAADAAALAGVISAQASASGGTAASDLATAKTAAQTTFTNILGTIDGVTIDTGTSSVTYASSSITSIFEWQAVVTNAFLPIMGLDSFTISGTASAAASANLPPYVDIVFVVDNSHSMAIGATSSDQTIMVKKTGCAIGCHMADGDTDTVTTARNAGATLRIDVVKSAISTMLTKAKTVQASTTAAGYGSRIRIGLYTLSNTLTKQHALSYDISAAQTAASAIEIDYSASQTGTNFHTAFSTLASAGFIAGDGKSASTPKTFIILMTDGIEDSATQKVTTTSTTKNGKTTTTTSSSLTRDANFTDYSPYYRDTSHGFNWDIQGFDPSLCTALKTAGINLMTLNIEYLIPSEESSETRFAYIKSTLKSSIQTNMASCATTSSWALYASTSADIVTATEALFTLALTSTPYLTK